MGSLFLLVSGIRPWMVPRGRPGGSPGLSRQLRGPLFANNEFRSEAEPAIFDKFSDNEVVLYFVKQIQTESSFI